MNSRTVITAEQAAQVARFVEGLPIPFTLTWREGAKRSLSANALLHKWYGEAAHQLGDVTAIQVKGRCHVQYGLPIRLRDEVFAWVWSKTGARLSYEKQCALFERGALAMTSEMTPKELSEYMDAMARDFRAQGLVLTDPEERKYEGAA